MDLDPYSNNSFIVASRIEPYISFENDGNVKTFNTIFLNDESETIVFSKSVFTKDYKFLRGSVDALSMKSASYMAVKKAIKDGLDISELKYYRPDFAIYTNLSVTEDSTLLIQDGIVMAYKTSMIDDLVLEDLKPTSKIDRINNYIINYNRRLSTSVFRDIEADELRKNIRVISKSKQKVKSA